MAVLAVMRVLVARVVRVVMRVPGRIRPTAVLVVSVAPVGPRVRARRVLRVRLASGLRVMVLMVASVARVVLVAMVVPGVPVVRRPVAALRVRLVWSVLPRMVVSAVPVVRAVMVGGRRT